MLNRVVRPVVYRTLQDKPHCHNPSSDRPTCSGLLGRHNKYARQLLCPGDSSNMHAWQKHPETVMTRMENRNNGSGGGSVHLQVYEHQVDEHLCMVLRAPSLVIGACPSKKGS